jgi:hypothetical protein
MALHAEEEPDEPDDPDEPEEAVATSPVPVVPTTGPSREYEFKLELISLDQVVDGKTLPEVLTKASADGWDLYEVIDAGDRRVFLLRRAKRNQREQRRVGFAPPGA